MKPAPSPAEAADLRAADLLAANEEEAAAHRYFTATPAAKDEAEAAWQAATSARALTRLALIRAGLESRSLED